MPCMESSCHSAALHEDMLHAPIPASYTLQSSAVLARSMYACRERTRGGRRDPGGTLMTSELAHATFLIRTQMLHTPTRASHARLCIDVSSRFSAFQVLPCRAWRVHASCLACMRTCFMLQLSTQLLFMTTAVLSAYSQPQVTVFFTTLKRTHS